MSVSKDTLDSATGAPPAITWLNMSGDVTITWDEENREAILALVQQKMKEGYSFFILAPRALSFLGHKKERLTNAAQLAKATAVVVPDDQVSAIVTQMGDAAVAQVVQGGKAKVAQAPRASKLSTTRRATTAAEVVRHQSVAVRAVVGG